MTPHDERETRKSSRAGKEVEAVIGRLVNRSLNSHDAESLEGAPVATAKE
jgi:hypothetical protein